ncbi:BQ2448_2993 [Microbotryum intermedium]|uniref:BQ2448_2993 protein n=1 Tax=Microbotryum intermedium TaxID=269621 RepID=A0A238FDZ6_9BASI|nr:BQ2448_2993 [Microbotryum intermedium]
MRPPTPSTSPSSASSSWPLSALSMPQFNASGEYVPYTTSNASGALSPMYTSPIGTPLSTPPIPAYAPISSTLVGPSLRSGLKRPHHLHHQVESASLNPIDETTDESDEDVDVEVGIARPNHPKTNPCAGSSSASRAAASSTMPTRPRHPRKKRRIVESFAGLSLDPPTTTSRFVAGLAGPAYPTTGQSSEPARQEGYRTQASPPASVGSLGQYSTIPSAGTSQPTPDIEDLPMGTGPSSFDLDEHRIYVASLDSPPPSPTLSPHTESENETDAADLTNLTIPTTMLMHHLPPPLPLDVIKSLEASENRENGGAQALVLYQPLKWTPQERERELEEFRREQARQERHADDDADVVDLEQVDGGVVSGEAEGNKMEID